MANQIKGPKIKKDLADAMNKHFEHEAKVMQIREKIRKEHPDWNSQKIFEYIQKNTNL